MCGIIHIKRKKGVMANKSVAKRYQKQKARGTEGFGFVELKEGVVIGVQRSEKEKDILELLSKSTADEILFHHRTPTSTPNFVESTHPIAVRHKKFKYNYYIVHNGIISNDDDLKAIHEKEDFVYNTSISKQWVTSGQTYESSMFNDSEAVAIDFAKSIETGEAMKSKGSIAIMALQVDKKTKKAIALYFGRNIGNPLKIENDKDFLGISSESGKDIPQDMLYCYTYETKEITEKAKDIGSLYSYYSKVHDEYPDYGHYDEATGTWIESKTKQSGLGINDISGYDDYADDDYDEFDFDYDDMINNLEKKITDAYRLGDYDKMCELEEEKESLYQNYKELVEESKRNKKSRKDKMGFHHHG